jgi:hypothetical protein
MQKKNKRDLMPARVKRAKKRLEELSHTFVRRRDSLQEDKIGGNCFDCGKYVEGPQYQSGHWQPSSSGGALLRFHPWNMNGQAAGCNCGYRQEEVKINYTMAMIEKYGKETVEKLLRMKQKSIKADLQFYESLITLYEKGEEQLIVDFLYKCADNA